LSLAQEGIEAVRGIRDENFTNLTPGTHGLSNDNKWNLTNSADTIEEFTRTLDITDINSQTKQVISKVSWKQSGGNQVSVNVSTIFTDWRTAVSNGTSTEFCGI